MAKTMHCGCTGPENCGIQTCALVRDLTERTHDLETRKRMDDQKALFDAERETFIKYTRSLEKKLITLEEKIACLVSR